MKNKPDHLLVYCENNHRS